MSRDEDISKPTVSRSPGASAQDIDLGEVGKLISALEQDLARVSSGSKDIQALRDEVEALRRALHSQSAHEEVPDRLHTLRHRVERASSPVLLEAIREGQYLAIIGRILGLS